MMVLTSINRSWVASTSARKPTTRRSRLITTMRTDSQAERTKRLRQLLAKPELLLGPAAYDGISAKLTEAAGFDFTFMSGFSVAGARLGYPDTALISYAEMLDQGRNMHEATQSIPIIGDGDTGYGNAMNVRRTVEGYTSAGFAGILIEDQIWPKSCGHVKGKRVVERDEAIMRIRAAVDARKDGQDIVIVARTDAKQAVSFEEALYRAAAFADAGADVVFVDALETVEEMERFCREIGTGAHKMANMLEGGGKTPIQTPQQLERMGFKLCAYPLSLLGVSINAMRKALDSLQTGVIPEDVPAFSDLQSVVGFPEYFRQESKYAVSASSSGALSNGGDGGSSSGSSSGGGSGSYRYKNEEQQQEQQLQRPPAVEADIVMEPNSGNSSTTTSTSSSRNVSSGTVDLVQSSRDEEYRQKERNNKSLFDDNNRRAQWIRIKLSDAKTGTVQLDTRFPAGFLGSIASFVPQVAGFDLEGLIRQAKGEQWSVDQPLVDTLIDNNDRLQIFLQFEE